MKVSITNEKLTSRNICIMSANDTSAEVEIMEEVRQANRGPSSDQDVSTESTPSSTMDISNADTTRSLNDTTGVMSTSNADDSSVQYIGEVLKASTPPVFMSEDIREKGAWSQPTPTTPRESTRVPPKGSPRTRVNNSSPLTPISKILRDEDGWRQEREDPDVIEVWGRFHTEAVELRQKLIAKLQSRKRPFSRKAFKYIIRRHNLDTLTEVENM